ncbi:MAG: UDP-N-acetylmuramate dehydrogenase [candidate division Zixibacteria bacterium]|nr:UDP-N-acetylmuramate dehydrogenase [candidate division Zixibacteria bacterium]
MEIAPLEVSVQQKLTECASFFRDMFGSSFSEDEPMSEHTSFKIGGPASLFLKASSPVELLSGINFARQLGLNYLLLGGGSNILVSDDGFHGLVIKNECKEYLVEDAILTAQSGIDLDILVDISCEKSLTGLEFAAGIWGTLGGAVCGNAGAFGGSISDVLTDAVVLNQKSEIVCVDKEYFNFSYRNSALKESGEIVLSASLQLENGDKTNIDKQIATYREKRAAKHPVDLPSAGSFFQNLRNPAIEGKETAAGWYLDQVGAREYRVGDAGVFEKHANIFVNHGKATAQDMILLAAELKKRVLERFDLSLQPEVRLVGDFSSCKEHLNSLLVS